MKKRIVQLLLCAVLCLALLPTAASAEARYFCGTCGGSGSGCGHSNSSVPYTEWTSTSSLPDKAGHYYLNRTVTLSSTWYPADDTVLYLDYDGVIYGPNGQAAIAVTDGRTFTLTGPAVYAGKITHKTGQTGNGIEVAGANSVFNMYGGIITGNTAVLNQAYSSDKNTYQGGGVRSYNKAAFNMYGGEITGNNSSLGSGSYLGGGVYSTGAFTMSGGKITGNKATDGGGVYSTGTFTMSGGVIGNNSSTNGGGVYSTKTLTVTGGIIGRDPENNISGNTAANGGGVYTSGTCKLEKSITIRNNSATTNGGGVYSSGGTLTLNGAVIMQNTATDGHGGGVYNTGALTLSGSTRLTDNKSYAGNGGGIYTTQATGISAGVTVSTNSAVHGGGVYASGSLTISGGTISGNTASGNGGGVFVRKSESGDAITHTMTGGIIDSNSADVGGGVYTGAGATFDMSGGQITTNKATLYTDRNPVHRRGGGVHIEGGAVFNLSGTAKINNNEADGNGGGVSNLGRLTMSGGEISGNVGGWRDVGNPVDKDGGGGVYNCDTFIMTGGTIKGNHLGQYASIYGYGGGVYNLKNFTMSGNAVLDGNRGVCDTYGNGYGGSVGNRGTFTMSDNAKIVNSVAGQGGGVYALSGSFTMAGNATVSSNEAKGSGGGVYIDSSASFTMEGGSISQNTASGNGGGIYNISRSAKMTAGEISGNRAVQVTYKDRYGQTTVAGGQGGGVYNYFKGSDHIPQFEMTGGKITNNTADRNGGGVYLYNEPYYSKDQRGSRLIVSGSAQITGNYKGTATENNVGLSVTDVKNCANCMVTVNSASFTGSVGITSDKHEVGQQMLNGSAVSSTYGRFFSDDARYTFDKTGKLICGHTHVVKDGDSYKCNDCGTGGLAVKVTSADNKISYYQTAAEASAAAANGSTLTLLVDRYYADLIGTATYTLDVNGTDLSGGIAISGGKVTITNGKEGENTPVTVSGGEAVIEGGTFGSVTVSGGKATISGGTFTKLTVESSGNATLSGGTFGSVRNYNGTGKASSLLATNCQYWNMDKGEAYEGSYPVVTNTTVTSTGSSITQLFIEGNTSMTYNRTATLTARMTGLAAGTTVSYSWKLTSANGVEATSGGETFSLQKSMITNKPLSVYTYTVTCVATCSDGKVYTATTPFTVNKADIQNVSQYTPTAKSLIYSGSPQELINYLKDEYDDPACPSGSAGITFSLNDDDSWSSNPPKATNAGTYTVYWEIDGGTNYNDYTGTPATVTIAPKTIEIASVTVANKEYDGTKTATVSEVTFTNDVTLVQGKDYTVSAEFADADVGDDKNVTVTVKLLNGNYTFAGGSAEATATGSAKISQYGITNTAPLTRYLKLNTTYTYPLNELVSGLTGRQVLGSITWDSNPTFTYTSGNTPTGGNNNTYSIDTDGNLTVKLVNRGISEATKVGTLTLKATAPNFKTGNDSGIKLTIDVYATNKTVAVRPTDGIYHTSITYGQPLRESTFTNESYLVDPDTTTTKVTGNFAWLNPNRLVEAGKRWVEWKFTPTNEGSYSIAYGAAMVTVERAVADIYFGESALNISPLARTSSTITHTYDGHPIDLTAKHNVWTKTGDTSYDYQLTDVPGAFVWMKSSQTVSAPVNVADSGDYTVKFIPNDSTNYQEVTFNVTVDIAPKALTVTGITAETRSYIPNDKNITLNAEHASLVGVEDGDDVSVSLKDAVGTMADANVGTNKAVTVTGVGLTGHGAKNYALTQQPTDVTVNITPKALTAGMVAVDYNHRLVYNGTAQSPTFTVEGGTLVKGTDYIISGGTASATDAGDYTLKITGQGNYTGTANVNWELEKKVITADMVKFSPLTYTGKPQSPTVTIKDSDTVLSVPYTLNGTASATDAGSYQMYLTGGGTNYDVRLSTTWCIDPAALTAKATVSSKAYDGTTAASVASLSFTDSSGNKVTLSPAQYTAGAYFATADAGSNKEAYVTVTLLNGNYCFTGADGAALATVTVPCTGSITRSSSGSSLIHPGSTTGGDTLPSVTPGENSSTDNAGSSLPSVTPGADIDNTGDTDTTLPSVTPGAASDDIDDADSTLPDAAPGVTPDEDSGSIGAADIALYAVPILCVLVGIGYLIKKKH